nr:response regulator [Paenibacillus monticola]
MVADDEPRHLRGMKNLISQLRPDVQVLIAKDGSGALELVRLEQPDVVLTDIRMPNMDGLAFLQQLKEEGLRAKVVVVSAYNLFEYAQTAVRHGAYDYLLKPVEAEKIENLLRRIEHQLVAESKQNLEVEEVRQRLHLASSAYRIRLYLAWLSGSLTAAERSELEEYGWLHGSGVVIYSELRNNGQSQDNYESANFLSSLEKAWTVLGEAVTVPLNTLQEEGLQAVTIVRTSPLTEDQKFAIRKIASALKSEWADAGQLTHGVGPECSALLVDAPQAYRVAQTVNKFNFYESWNGVIFQDELCHSQALITLTGEKLLHALQDEDAGIAIELCKTAFLKLSDGGNMEPLIMKENASLLLMKLKSSIYNHADRQAGVLMTNGAIRDIQACVSYGMLMSFIEDTLLRVHNAVKQVKLEKNERIIEACLNWIQDNLKEELSLERTAEHFFFNTSYFSTLIKSRTGKTFSEHVTEARMKHAKALLAENKLRIYEISVECGYQDTKYFCRVFKKVHGLSPEAFKHHLLPQRRAEE